MLFGGDKMKIGLYLFKIFSFTHCKGVYGDEIWARALMKGLNKIEGIECQIYGENFGFAGQSDIAIYFNITERNNKWYGKENIIFHQNFWLNDEENQRRIDNILSTGFRIATISKYWADKYNWKMLYPAVDTDMFYPQKYTEKYNFDLAYIGNNIKDQQKTKDYFTIPGLKYGVYGNGFNKPISHRESLKVYSSAKANLNFGFDKKLEIIAPRIFQVAACKGLIICEYLKVYKDIFGDSMFWVENDVQVEIKNFLNIIKADPKRIEQMKEKAFSTVLNDYSCDKQAKELWRWINER